MSAVINIVKRFTLFRIFSTQKLIKSHFLNKMGLQLFRIRMASFIYGLRKNKSTSIITQEYEQYQRDGIVQIDDFLDESKFESLKKEARDVVNKGIWDTERTDGPNTIYIRKISELNVDEYPTLFQLTKDEKLNALFRAVEKRNLDIAKGEVIVQVQYLTQGKDTPNHDPETELHSDTFFNTNKAWLYLNDVASENGPFVYVRGSHKLDLKNRMKKEFEHSLDKETKGSRRVYKDELIEAGLNEEHFTCKENTLVLANTFGYHRRARGKDGYDRLTIAFSARYNPFLIK